MLQIESKSERVIFIKRVKRKHIVVIAFGLLVILGIGFAIDEEEASNTYHTESSNTISTTSSIPVTSTKTTTTTTVTTTTVSATTAIESTTATETTAAIEEISDESCLYEEQEIYEEYEDNDTEYLESAEVDYDTNETYSDWYTAKWYTGSIGTYGYSGRDLISGYSVASSDFPQGTLLQITGGGLDGVYRVDDSGCPSGIIDFFYYYGEVPSHFEYNGVYDIEVCVIG